MARVKCPFQQMSFFKFFLSFFLSKDSEYGSVTLKTLGNQTSCFVTDSIVLQLFSSMALVSL